MSYSFGWIEIHCVDHCNNKCAFCNNHSPYAKKREYRAADYVPWIDKLIKMGVKFYCLSVLGGEPFLHSDLRGFIAPLRKNYDYSIMLTTNGYWLSEENIDKNAAILREVDILCFSLYPNMHRKPGSLEKAREYIQMIEDRFTNLRAEVRVINKFGKFELTESPVEVDRYCPAADCTCLLADGRLARCGVGAFAHISPHASSAFLDADHMFYDLKNQKENFWLWRKRWPLDACRYCTHFRFEHVDWDYTKRIPPRKNSRAHEGRGQDNLSGKP